MPHADHIGGLIEVLGAFKVDQIWHNGDTSESKTYADFMDGVQSEGAEIHIARLHNTIEAGELKLFVHHPANLEGSTNNNSIVLHLAYGEIDFLFTGDAEKEAEGQMMELSSIRIPEVEILKVGHHGSKTASSLNFLGITSPEVAIYMAAEDNQYGHPHQETITALNDISAKIYGTDIHWNIVITTDGKDYDLYHGIKLPSFYPPIITPTPSPTPSPTPNDTVFVYITRTGEKYRRGSCRYLSQSKISIKRSDAINQGYTPCSGCKPDGIQAPSFDPPTITPTPSPTPSPTPTPVTTDVKITKIFYDGQVYRVESDEYVEIKNLGSEPVDLAGWKLVDIDEGYPALVFLSYMLESGESVRVYTNEVHPEYGGFSFNSSKAVWNNTSPDTAVLYNAQGQEVSRKSY
ncbi:lamin tail domain-containing protein [Chloroflexota bacterium]